MNSRIPASWARHERAVYRACTLCTHGALADGKTVRGTGAEATHCIADQVVEGGPPMPAQLARANLGPCGPDAWFQDFPGLAAA